MTPQAVHLVACKAGYGVIDADNGYVVAEGLTQQQAQEIAYGPVPTEYVGRGFMHRTLFSPPQTAKGRYIQKYHEWLEEAE